MAPELSQLMREECSEETVGGESWVQGKSKLQCREKLNYVIVVVQKTTLLLKKLFRDQGKVQRTGSCHATLLRP